MRLRLAPRTMTLNALELL